MQRILEFIRYPSHSRTLGLLALLAVLLSIPLTVNIAQKQQELRQRAAYSICQQKGGVCLGSVCYVKGVPYSDWSCDTACTPTHAVSCNPACGTPETCGKPSTCIDDCGNTYQGQCDACPATPQPATPTAPPTQSPATAAPVAAQSCPNFPGGGTCTYTGLGQTTTNPNSCNGTCPTGMTTSNGSTTFTGTSVKECQTTGCYYDRYYDTSQSQSWRTAACYDTNHECQTAQNSPTTTCPSGQNGVCQGGGTPSVVNASNNTWKCSNGFAPTCSSTQIATPNCDDFTSQPLCLAAANSCSATTGTQTGTADKLQSTGSTSCTHAPLVKQCNPPSNPTTCASPNTCNSSNQCVGPSGAAPSATSGNSIVFNFSIGLDGIGAIGDSKTKVNSRSNQNPHTPTRVFQVQVFDQNNNLLTVNGATTTRVSLDFDSNSGLFTKQWTPGVAAGTYSVRITTYGHLWKHPSAQSMAIGQAVTFQTDLPAGNLNPDSDNSIGTDDYVALGSCAFQPATSSGLCQAADLDDSGTVDLSDLNLLLRDFGLTGDN